MKVIDLLNKIAKAEEVPEKIKWHCVEFNYINGDYINCNSCSLFRHDVDIYTVLNMLNDEIEIIEEDKKIEKIDGIYAVDHKWQSENNNMFTNKINELIDEVNKTKGGNNEKEDYTIPIRKYTELGEVTVKECVLKEEYDKLQQRIDKALQELDKYRINFDFLGFTDRTIENTRKILRGKDE